MGYFTAMICPWDKKGGDWGSLWLLESLTIKKLGAVTGTVWEKMEGKQTGGKFNSCLRDVHVFLFCGRSEAIWPRQVLSGKVRRGNSAGR